MTRHPPTHGHGVTRRGADLRLALPALAGWLSAWVAGAPWRPGPAVALAVLPVVLVLLAARTGARHAVLLGVAVCASAGATVTLMHDAARTRTPLTGWARDGAAVTVVGSLTTDPRSVASGPGGRGAAGPASRTVVVRLTARVVERGDQRVTTRAPLVALGRDDPAWRDLLPGQRVVVQGRLGPPRPGDDVTAVLSLRAPPTLLGRAPPVQRVAGAVRAGLRRAVADLPDGPRGLLPALVVGDTSRLPETLEEQFRDTGLTHLTAVSGTNVAIVVGAVLLALRRCGVRGRGAVVLALVALAGFVVLARPSPSVLRAAAMGAVGLWGLASSRRTTALPALAAATFALVLVDPSLAAAPGFALSVLATAALLLLAPPWADGLRRLLPRWVPRWLPEAVAVPAAATVACGPVVVALSSQVGLWSVPANLLAAPAVAPATVLGVLVAVTAPVCLPLAQLLAWLGWAPVAWLCAVARVGAALPGAAVPFPGGARGAVLLLGATLLCWWLVVLLRHRPVWRRPAAALGVGVLLGASALRVVLPGWPARDWGLVMCDVGQGDLLLVRAGPDAAVAVDAGPDPALAERCLRRAGVRQLPLVLLTHHHADHVDGLPALLRRPVGALLLSPLGEPSAQHADVLRLAARAGVPVQVAAPGERRRVGTALLSVLGPDHLYRGTRSDPNNTSVVVLAESGGLRALLTGDVEPEAQQDLLAARVPRPHVLKVPHHGSRHQDEAFLDAAVGPVALVSLGADNDYGHPAADVLAQLTAAGSQVWRTDRHGHVAVSLRGSRVSVSSSR